MTKYLSELDQTDIGILNALLKDARRAYTDIAEELEISGATVHLRVDKLKSLGIIRGSKIKISYQALGYDVIAFIGVVLGKAKDYKKALAKINKLPQVIEAHYTTGSYNIFTKVILKNMSDLHQFLLNLQTMEEIHTTETIVVLDTPIKRELSLG